MDAVTSQPQAHRIRSAEPDDIPFIVLTWLQSFWQESVWANRVTWQVYKGTEGKPGHEEIITRLLSQSAVLVACNPEIESEIAGYFVYEPDPLIAHWAYVKPAFRRLGIARALLKASALPQDLRGVRITHATRSWCTVKPLRDSVGNVIKPAKIGIEERFKGAVHDPYLWLIREQKRGKS